VRILVDYRPALRQRSGAGVFIHGLVHAYARGPGRDDEVVLFSSSLRDQIDPDDEPGFEIANRRVPVRVLNRLWHRLEWPPVERLIGGSFDVVHSPHPLMLPTRSAARVITIHDLDFLDHPERTEAEIRRDYPALVREHALAADHIVVSSAFTAGEVHLRLDVPRHLITVCRPGAPPWPPRTAAPDGGPILFIGTLEPRKNVSGLLDAYELLLASSPRPVPELLLAGRATRAAQPWLERLSQPPLKGHARHLGYVTDAERLALFQRACLLVLPSFNEGFGLPVLEAMTLGVPVIASDRGAIPEVLGDAGVMVDPEAVDALADAMGRLLVDPDAAAAAAARGIRRSRLFDWDEAATALRVAYTEAVAAHRARQTAIAASR